MEELTLHGEQHVWYHRETLIRGRIGEEDVGTNYRIEAGDDVGNDLSFLEGHGDVGQQAR